NQPAAFFYLPTAFLLSDLDVAVDGLDDEGRAAASKLTGEVLTDHLLLDFETERIVRLNLAGYGLGFDLCVGCAAEFDFDVAVHRVEVLRRIKARVCERDL